MQALALSAQPKTCSSTLIPERFIVAATTAQGTFQVATLSAPSISRKMTRGLNISVILVPDLRNRPGQIAVKAPCVGIVLWRRKPSPSAPTYLLIPSPLARSPLSNNVYIAEDGA